MNIKIAPEYAAHREWVATLPARFSLGQGELLYDGRNQIRAFDRDGVRLVVKRYKRHNLLKRLVYTFFRKNKARRSYDHAQQLLRRGFQTPRPVAYMEERRLGTISQVYYVCTYTEAQPIRPRLIEQEPFDRKLATAYAHFVVQLHEAGVLHKDLNPGNVLFTEQGGDCRFELIDINRMYFFDGSVPKAECMENLTLFWWLTDVYRYILQVYAEERHWTDDDIKEAICVKERHDRRWVRRKNFTAIFKHKK